MALINIDVFSRLLFNRPISGVPLIIEMSIIVIVFLQLAAALRRGRMTRSDVVIGRLLDNRPATGHLLQGVYHLAGFVLMILLIQYSLPLFSKAWRRGTYAGLEGDFTLPIWPIKLLIVVGAAVIMVQFLRLVRRDIQFFRYHSIHSTSEGRGVMYGLIAVAAVVISFLAMAMVIELSSVQIGLISIFFVLLLVFVGVHVGVALALLSFVCVWMIRGDMEIAGRLLALSAGESLRRYEFGVIPLFILMGLLVSVSDIGKDTYEVANHVFRRVKGGLGSATVAANAVFAAVTGTSIASASVFTKVAVPEMLRLGYKPRFAVGVVAGSSVLGMLIPPSLLLILFGILTETSIGDLFIAGILPGIVLSAAYCVLIWLMAHKFPNYVADASTLENALDSNLTSGEIVSKSVPILVLIFIIMGGIYGGLFTATEAGGVGVLGALVLTIAKRKLTWKRLWDALTETGYVTAAICFLLLSAHLYARMISISGIPNVMESMIMQSGMGLAGLITIYVVIIILLGTILDAGSIMLITVPLALVAVQPFGVDLIWLGIVTIIAVEIGLLTPPLGLAVFVIHNNLEDHRISVDDIFWGAAPFALTMLVVLILVLLIPDIALVLVR